MPCNADYMNPSNFEKDIAKVYALLDELDGRPLPKNYGDGYDPRTYNKYLLRSHLDEKVEELCSKIQKIDVKSYSLEMQIWWRDHQKADKERIEAELKVIKDKTAKEIALAKLTPHERKLLHLYYGT